MQDPNVEALLTYLRQNAERFSPEALELQMRAAGHSEANLAAAFERFDDEMRRDASPWLGGTQRIWKPRVRTSSPLAAAPRVATAEPTVPVEGAPAVQAAEHAAAIPPPPSSPPSSISPQVARPPALPVPPSSALSPAIVGPRRPAWGPALGVVVFDLVLGGAGYGLAKGGAGKVAWMGGCVLILVPLALLLQLLVGLILTAADGSSRAGRAMLYGSLLVLGLAALTLAGAGIFLAVRAR